MTLPVKRANAAICKQGHVVSPALWLMEPTQFCAECGEQVETSCRECGAAIPGRMYDVLPVTGRKRLIPGAFSRPGFCVICGAPFPWVDRGELISELIKRLDEEDLAPDEKLTAREQLEALSDPDLSEDEQKERWQRVRAIAPKVLTASGRILERLAGEAIRQTLGL